MQDTKQGLGDPFRSSTQQHPHNQREPSARSSLARPSQQQQHGHQHQPSASSASSSSSSHPHPHPQSHPPPLSPPLSSPSSSLQQQQQSRSDRSQHHYQRPQDRVADYSTEASSSSTAAKPAATMPQYTSRDVGDPSQIKKNKQSMADLKLRRLTELNNRLREDLERERIPVSQAAKR